MTGSYINYNSNELSAVHAVAKLVYKFAITM